VELNSVRRNYMEKAWLDKLYYDIGKQQFDFLLCGTYEKDGEKKFTKWKKYSECIFPIDFDGTYGDWKKQKFFEQINQRQIFPNEIVFDLEEKKQLPDVVKKLKEWNIPFKIYSTGSRGYHVHCWFDEKLSEREKSRWLKEFGADIQKNSDKTMIALEDVPHWKSGKIKEKIIWNS